ncbi:MAG: sel1 repeat family protein [Armatimonadetes bacterium]|nr:sel1 repeat family protein [Akkermansiaceae bacterium]
MKTNPSHLLMLALIMVPLAKGDGVADLLARAEKGESVAQLELGVIYSKGEGVKKDMAVAVKWLTQAAEQGNEDAQMKLGGIYIGGRGVPKSSSEAAKWFMMSAEKGSAAAQCQIARMHLSGAGVPKDDVEGYKWADLAASQGDAAAKKVLAFLLLRMTPEQIADGKQRSHGFLELKKAEGSLELPAALPPVPVESLPLFAPE